MSLQTWLKDYGLNAGSILLALIGIALTILLRAKIKKELSYDFTIDRILNVDENLKDDVQVYFRGDKISDLSLVRILTKNTGSDPIRKGDFEGPISYSFGEQVTILSSTIKTKSVNDLAPEIKASANEILVQPLLLNSQEWFVIDILATGLQPLDVSAKCRVAGIKRVTIIDEKSSAATVIQIIGIAMIIISFIIYFSQGGLSAEIQFYGAHSAVLGSILLSLIGMTLNFYGLLASRKPYKSKRTSPGVWLRSENRDLRGSPVQRKFGDDNAPDR